MSFHPVVPYGTPAWHKSERKLAEPGPPFAFTPEHRREVEAHASHYPPERRKSAIIGALYVAQAQQGYLSANAMRHVAEVVDCSTAEVEDVVSYYVMFFTQPVGKYVLQVCRTLSCALRGAGRVTEEIRQELGIGIGETDQSGTFTLMEMECLGACDRAPVVMVNNEHWHECLQPGQVADFLRALRERGLEALNGCHHVKE